MGYSEPVIEMDVRLISIETISNDVLFSSTEQPGTINALHTDGEILYSFGSKGQLMTWSLETLRHLRTYKIGSEDLLSAVIDTELVCIGSTSHESPVSIWRKDDLSPVIKIKDEQGSVLDMANAGGEIVTARSSGTIDFFSKSDWAKIISLDSEHDIATILEIDNDYIYAGGVNDFVNVLKNPGYISVAKLEGHEADIFSLCSDGDHLYSGSGEIWWGGPGSPRPPSFESAIRVWKKGSWECVEVLEGHTDNVNEIVADTSHLFSVSDDGTLRSYVKSDFTQIALKVDTRPITSLLLHDDFLYLSNSEGKILRIAKEKLVD